MLSPMRLCPLPGCLWRQRRVPLPLPSAPRLIGAYRTAPPVSVLFHMPHLLIFLHCKAAVGQSQAVGTSLLSPSPQTKPGLISLHRSRGKNPRRTPDQPSGELGCFRWQPMGRNGMPDRATHPTGQQKEAETPACSSAHNRPEAQTCLP